MGRYVGLLFADAATACGADKVCLTFPNPAFVVEIRDSLTNAPSAYRASLIVEGNGFYDSTYVGPPADSLAARDVISKPERAGTFTVRVRRVGYRLWERNGIDLGSGCELAPSVTLSVRLQRLP